MCESLEVSLIVPWFCPLLSTLQGLPEEVHACTALLCPTVNPVVPAFPAGWALTLNPQGLSPCDGDSKYNRLNKSLCQSEWRSLSSQAFVCAWLDFGPQSPKVPSFQLAKAEIWDFGMQQRTARVS